MFCDLREQIKTNTNINLLEFPFLNRSFIHFCHKFMIRVEKANVMCSVTGYMSGVGEKHYGMWWWHQRAVLFLMYFSFHDVCWWDRHQTFLTLPLMLFVTSHVDWLQNVEAESGLCKLDHMAKTLASCFLQIKLYEPAPPTFKIFFPLCCSQIRRCRLEGLKNWLEILKWQVLSRELKPFNLSFNLES